VRTKERKKDRHKMYLDDLMYVISDCSILLKKNGTPVSCQFKITPKN